MTNRERKLEMQGGGRDVLGEAVTPHSRLSSPSKVAAPGRSPVCMDSVKLCKENFFLENLCFGFR